MSEQESRRCIPGDITVMPVPGGSIIGRVLPQRGPGAWWEYVKTVADFREALREAIRLARENQVTAWLTEDGNNFRELSRHPWGSGL